MRKWARKEEAGGHSRPATHCTPKPLQQIVPPAIKVLGGKAPTSTSLLAFRLHHSKPHPRPRSLARTLKCAQPRTHTHRYIHSHAHVCVHSPSDPPGCWFTANTSSHTNTSGLSAWLPSLSPMSFFSAVSRWLKGLPQRWEMKKLGLPHCGGAGGGWRCGVGQASRWLKGLPRRREMKLGLPCWGGDGGCEGSPGLRERCVWVLSTRRPGPACPPPCVPAGWDAGKRWGAAAAPGACTSCRAADLPAAAQLCMKPTVFSPLCARQSCPAHHHAGAHTCWVGTVSM